jgi:mannose-1-phosphate guanylyltransferase
MKALILCAGYGTRLGDLTKEIPKPMLQIQNQPLLAYNIQYLASYGFDEIAINLHYKPEMIVDALGSGSQYGVTLHYVYEDHLLGTAGAVRNLIEFWGDSRDYLVLYGDLLLDQDLNTMLNTHYSKEAVATLLLHQRRNSNSLIQMNEEHRITAFIERPTEEERRANNYFWVNSGVQLLNHRVLDYIPRSSPVDLPRDVYTTIVNDEPIFGVPLTGYRIALDSPERYEKAQQAVATGEFSPHWLTSHTE